VLCLLDENWDKVLNCGYGWGFVVVLDIAGNYPSETPKTLMMRLKSLSPTVF